VTDRPVSCGLDDEAQIVDCALGAVALREVGRLDHSDARTEARSITNPPNHGARFLLTLPIGGAGVHDMVKPPVRPTGASGAAVAGIWSAAPCRTGAGRWRYLAASPLRITAAPSDGANTLSWPSFQRTRTRGGFSRITSSITPVRDVCATRSDSTTIRSPTFGRTSNLLTSSSCAADRG
jgi:hypothetical protein